jgi:hypothetical protein
MALRSRARSASASTMGRPRFCALAYFDEAVPSCLPCPEMRHLVVCVTADVDLIPCSSALHFQFTLKSVQGQNRVH